MAYLSSGASQIIYARQYRHSGSKALQYGIVARTANLEMRRLWDSSIIHRVSKHQLKLWAIEGVKKKEMVNKIVSEAVAEKAPSNISPQSKDDVFVSFRGEDIRHGFFGHLVIAFPRKQINAFVDEKLKRGDDMSHSLVEAIEGSPISLVIFS
ncbi:putative TIR domain-containing protein [Medicago truncatula]|uniref:Putative TIR domain-containing protein n=1 Tax=Medicago truncatula TaxID=3880 RepID=A0A396I1J9_MEDTR|nr:putative TIR domain-containing protein [Medicago truncatula]